MWDCPAVKSRDRRVGHGTVIFPSPEALWDNACQYFKWNQDNPIVEEKLFFNKYGIHRGNLDHPRPLTISAMCVYIGIGRSSWYEYCQRDNFKEVCEEITAAIYNQKLAYAAADMMNAMLIGKELGIAEKTVVTNKHELTDASNEELDRKLEELRRLTNEPSAKAKRD